MTILISTCLVTAKPHFRIKQSATDILHVFSGEKSKRYITIDLMNIARDGHSLTEETKRELKNIGFNFDGPIVNRTLGTRNESEGLDEILDNGMFRFHYTQTGSNAVSTLDTNGNSIPDYVEQMANVFDFVSSAELTTLGFVEPPGDGWYPANDDNGGSSLFDIYIRNPGSGVYGYVQPETWANGDANNEHSPGVTELNAMTSYMVMRHNYNGFPNSLLENIQVTAAHEYFHAIQFGYDGWEEPWVMEATAVQLEELLYDDINDCYQYMPSWFNSPHKPLNLDSQNRWYGSFIFFEYVQSHLNKNTIRKFWEKSVNHDSYYSEYSIQTLDEVFQGYGSSFIEMLNGMSIANRILSSSLNAANYAYEEADSYTVSPSTFSTVSFSTGEIKIVSSTNLDKNAAQYIKLNSSDPVSVVLSNDSGPDTDLLLHAIMSYGDSTWTVWSGNSINVDPRGITKVHFVIVSQNPNGSNFDYTLTITDGQASIGHDLPNYFTVSNGYPNPFNPQINFRIELVHSEQIQVTIYDVNGRMITEITNRKFNSGQHVVTWNGLDNSKKPVSSGIYFVRVQGEIRESWQKISMLK